MNILRIIPVVIYHCALLRTSPVMADHVCAVFETGAAGAIMTVPGATLPRGAMVFGVCGQFVAMDEMSNAEL